MRPFLNPEYKSLKFLGTSHNDIGISKIVILSKKNYWTHKNLWIQFKMKTLFLKIKYKDNNFFDDLADDKINDTGIIVECIETEIE